MSSPEPRAWERPDGTVEDPRVEMLAEGLIAAWPILSEESRAKLRPRLVTLLASLDAVGRGPARNEHGDVDLIDEAWSLLTDEKRDDAWEAARDRWGIRYGQNEPPRGGPDKARLLEEMWRRRTGGAS